MSRLRSGRASRGGSARPQAGRPGIYLQTPKSDIFVTMLAIALGAIFLGCMMLVIVMGRYGFSIKAASLTPNAAVSLASVSIAERNTSLS